jgi:integrase
VRGLLDSSDDGFVALIALCAFGGLRLGEAAALQVGDIRFLEQEIDVKRQVQRTNGKGVEIRAPKYGSDRTIFAPPQLLSVLAEHIRVHCPGDDPARWMFPGEEGHPLHQNSVGYWWRRARKNAGLSWEPHLHSLRHFYASGLIAAGCDVVTVQRALGHKSATVTLSTYSHLWPDANERTRLAADQLFNQVAGTAADSLRTEDSKTADDQRL